MKTTGDFKALRPNRFNFQKLRGLLEFQGKNKNKKTRRLNENWEFDFQSTDRLGQTGSAKWLLLSTGWLDLIQV